MNDDIILDKDYIIQTKIESSFFGKKEIFKNRKKNEYILKFKLTENELTKDELNFLLKKIQNLKHKNICNYINNDNDKIYFEYFNFSLNDLILKYKEQKLKFNNDKIMTIINKILEPCLLAESNNEYFDYLFLDNIFVTNNDLDIKLANPYSFKLYIENILNYRNKPNELLIQNINKSNQDGVYLLCILYFCLKTLTPITYIINNKKLSYKEYDIQNLISIVNPDKYELDLIEIIKTFNEKSYNFKDLYLLFNYKSSNNLNTKNDYDNNLQIRTPKYVDQSFKSLNNSDNVNYSYNNYDNENNNFKKEIINNIKNYNSNTKNENLNNNLSKMIINKQENNKKNFKYFNNIDINNNKEINNNNKEKNDYNKYVTNDYSKVVDNINKNNKNQKILNKESKVKNIFTNNTHEKWDIKDEFINKLLLEDNINIENNNKLENNKKLEKNKKIYKNFTNKKILEKNSTNNNFNSKFIKKISNKNLATSKENKITVNIPKESEDNVAISKNKVDLKVLEEKLNDNKINYINFKEDNIDGETKQNKPKNIKLKNYLENLKYQPTEIKKQKIKEIIKLVKKNKKDTLSQDYKKILKHLIRFIKNQDIFNNYTKKNANSINFNKKFNNYPVYFDGTNILQDPNFCYDFYKYSEYHINPNYKEDLTGIPRKNYSNLMNNEDDITKNLKKLYKDNVKLLINQEKNN